MNTTFAIFLDLLVVGLLVATIVYAMSLNRSIAKLRDGKAELAVLLQNLGEAVTHAETAINGMKIVAAEQDQSLSRQIGTARALVDELQVINETANNLASRIERAVQNGRTVTPLARPAPVTRKADPFAALLEGIDADEIRPSPGKGRSPAAAPRSGRGGSERELIEAIDLLRRGA